MDPERTLGGAWCVCTEGHERCVRELLSGGLKEYVEKGPERAAYRA